MEHIGLFLEMESSSMRCDDLGLGRGFELGLGLELELELELVLELELGLELEDLLADCMRVLCHLCGFWLVLSADVALVSRNNCGPNIWTESSRSPLHV